jgi:hypothetical protein
VFAGKWTYFDDRRIDSKYGIDSRKSLTTDEQVVTIGHFARSVQPEQVQFNNKEMDQQLLMNS